MIEHLANRELLDVIIHHLKFQDEVSGIKSLVN